MRGNIKEALAGLLVRGGVSANVLTLLGFLAAGISGLLLYWGNFFWGAAVLLLSGGLDLLDGAVARASGTAGRFGGILDSSLDRYGDAFALGGILFFCAHQGKFFYGALSFSALLGSFLISYVRARAECEMPSCRVGFWEKGERIVYLSLGLMLNHPGASLWVLGIGTHWTALGRLLYAAGRDLLGASRARRGNAFYFLKAAFLVGFLLFYPTGW